MNARIDISQVILETERLILRPFQETDLDDLYEYAKDPGVGEMAGWLHHQSKEESAQILKAFIEHKKTFAIWDKETKKVIGSLGVEAYDENLFSDFAELKGRELGYVLSKAYWGRGLMPEAVKRVIQYLFEVVQVDFITCAHFLTNLQSKRVIEKCGFQFYANGEFDGKIGIVKDAAYILRKEEYENEKL